MNQQDKKQNINLNRIVQVVTFQHDDNIEWYAKKNCLLVREADCDDFDLLIHENLQEKYPHFIMSMISRLYSEGISVRSTLDVSQKVLDSFINVEEEKPAELEKKIQDLLIAACMQNVSDIHFRIGHVCHISFRIDGDLIEHVTLSSKLGEALIYSSYNSFGENQEDTVFNKEKAYFWSMSHTLNIPNGLKQSVRIRCQSEPCFRELSVVWRILKLDNECMTLDELGYLDHQQDQLNQLVQYPSGLIAMVGTTGSGKSTTLASLLERSHQQRPNSSIRTVESPVEYDLPFAVQRSLDEKRSDIGSAFAAATEVKMRLDPDILMVGEVRCHSSAKAMADAVSTGHLVLTSVHAASNSQVVHRLTRLGVPEDVLQDPTFFLGSIFQKLVQKLCPHCKVPFDESIESEDKLLSEAIKSHMDTKEIYGVGKGCKKCKNRGYEGRTVVAEVMRSGVPIDFEHTLIGVGLHKIKAGTISPKLLVKALGPLPMKDNKGHNDEDA